MAVVEPLIGADLGRGLIFEKHITNFPNILLDIITSPHPQWIFWIHHYQHYMKQEIAHHCWCVCAYVCVYMSVHVCICVCVYLSMCVSVQNYK